MASRLHSYAIRRTLRIVVVVIGVLLVTALLSYGVVQVFTVRSVVVDAPGMTVELDRTGFGGNLLFLPTDKFRQELLNAYPQLSDVEFEKKVPGTLIIHFVRRSAVAVLKSDGNYYALDARGVVVDTPSGFDGFSRLTFDVGTYSPGSTIQNESVRASLVMLSALPREHAINEFTIGKGSSIQARVGNTNILFPHSGDTKAKAATLQVIVEGFRIKGTLPTVIDLRFEKPIITN